MNPSFFLWFPVNSKSGSFYGLAHSPSPGRYSDPFFSAQGREAGEEGEG